MPWPLAINVDVSFSQFHSIMGCRHKFFNAQFPFPKRNTEEFIKFEPLFILNFLNELAIGFQS